MGPSFEQFIEVFRRADFETALCPELCAGQAERRRNPGPVMVQEGAFGLVFRLRHPTLGTLACKVFYAIDAQEVIERYQAISQTLLSHRGMLPTLIPVRLYSEGLSIAGYKVPVIAMPWIEGHCLAEYVEDRCSQIAEGRLSAEAFDSFALSAQFALGMVSMERFEIAHGDLSALNVFVSPQQGRNRLRLIDYDNMYVPQLAGKKGLSHGSVVCLAPNTRTGEHQFGPEEDRIAAAVLFGQLFFLTPERWKKYPGPQRWLLDVRSLPLAEELRQGCAAWKDVLNYYESALRALEEGSSALPSMTEFLQSAPALVNAFRRAGYWYQGVQRSRFHPVQSVSSGPGLAKAEDRANWTSLGGRKAAS